MIDVTLAIANQLGKIVPGATVYRENQEQGFKEPSFYVYEIMADSKSELMKYETRKHLYCVMWFPDSKSDDPGLREQCEKMRSKLVDEFKRIDDLAVTLLNKEARIESGALNFTFKIQYRVTQIDTTPKLKTLVQNRRIKE